MKFILTLLLALTSSAIAQTAELTITPAAILETGLNVVVGQRLEFRLVSAQPDLQTVTLNLTRAGRVVGDYPMRRDGNDWITSLKLESPYAHVATVRQFEKERVWSSALDLYALETEDAKLVTANNSASLPLDFVVTEGKPGNDANPWWGIAAMLALVIGVFLGTQGLRRKPPAPPTPKAPKGEAS
ncbi:MAG: hypothetical protein HC933_00120 [Pleurocapsa sp. SU_196_0]|nr:hypothetical protein [Pleurocapsa sp. SU_196_0]